MIDIEKRVIYEQIYKKWLDAKLSHSYFKFEKYLEQKLRETG